MIGGKPTEVRVSFKAWVLAWACSIFLSCALLAALYPQAGANFPIRVWQIADEMAPMAKLSFGGLLFLVFALLHRLAQFGRALTVVAFGAASALVPVIVMTIIPAAYSRGFGIGFSGARFAFAEIACWMVGCLAGGLLYARSRSGT